MEYSHWIFGSVDSVIDLVGTVEVIVFPKDYEKYSTLLEEDGKIFVQGRVAAEDDKPSKIICEKVWSFDSVARELWIQFATISDYEKQEAQLLDALSDSDGNDSVVIYVREPKAIKRLPANRNVQINSILLGKLHKIYGQDNVKVVEKSIEKRI